MCPASWSHSPWPAASTLTLLVLTDGVGGKVWQCGQVLVCAWGRGGRLAAREMSRVGELATLRPPGFLVLSSLGPKILPRERLSIT